MAVSGGVLRREYVLGVGLILGIRGVVVTTAGLAAPTVVVVAVVGFLSVTRFF